MIHLERVSLFPDRYPTHEHYPFNLEVFQKTPALDFTTPVTFLCGENGSGKTTLLRALCRKCDIHMWEGVHRTKATFNQYEDLLHRAIEVKWTDGSVPGSFFSSEIFHNFAQLLDEWGAIDERSFSRFGGKSLLTQSHGQSLMSLFRHRYKIKGIYFMDEPETALSPRSQLELLDVLEKMSEAGHAQFVVATHSPILLACPDATIYDFNSIPVQHTEYEETEHYRVYRDFLLHRETFLETKPTDRSQI